ncbi:MAG TPA: prenyltransferase/squalene oxidase repeat-containing protein [Solirubrobacteraceae bacterium]|nr:prenyltransferase/squalene oxidase repeat-containing protein [Solirubrobacteraceae bacterium]
MSWQLGAFAVLALGLLAGFAWYEHTRPDARIVALVGTLAAFGALGRIAFAAVPNVKPTSDIVLISGYVLGGAPGYVVGAVAALTSNFFFGQGPWTPWQMAGWGLTGIAGALLARITRRRIGRLPLALVCFVLGFAFTALQDVGDWVTYSDHSLAQLGVYVGKGIGFDLVHACGCFGFAMLFGPALIRMLQRFRTRMQVTWLPPAARAGLPVVLGLAVLAGGVGAARPAAAAAATKHRTPVEFLFGAENRDGGVGMSPGQPSNVLASGWQAIALDVSGMDPYAHAKSGGRGVISYLADTVNQERGAGALERTILAVGLVPYGAARATDFGGRDLVAALRRAIAANGAVSDQTNLTAFAIVALRAAHAPVPSRAVAWLARQQDRDGGFNFDTRGGSSDVDDTGAVLSALGGTGYRSAIRRAVSFIRGQQNRDGGFGDEQGGPSNAQSTAFAICGLIAAGVKPAGLHRHGSASPVTYLDSLIQPDGAVDYARGNAQTPVWVTAEAEMALSGHTL